jgi:nitrogen fixation protein FixH
MTIYADGQDKDGRLTGRHVLAILLLFFAVVGTVNFVMVRYALLTFRGEVQDNPYEAGLAFNREIDAAQAQAARNWRVEGVVRRTDGGRAELDLSAQDARGEPISGLTITGGLAAPADKRLDRPFAFEEARLGFFVGTVDAPAGQWDLNIELSRDGERLFRSHNRITLR